MPWHMTAFHPDYKMTRGISATTADDLLKIVEIGVQAGLKYIYPGMSTFCAADQSIVACSCWGSARPSSAVSWR